jgi:serine protease Do
VGLEDALRLYLESKEIVMRYWKSPYWSKVLTAAAFAPLLAGALIVAVVAASLPNSGLVPGEGAKGQAVGAAKLFSQGFREAAKAVQPAVVMIKSEPTIAIKSDGQAPWGGENPFGGPSRGMPDMRRFFKEMPQMPKGPPSGMGSGLVVDAAGVILTNNHVVRGGGEIAVRLHDGREFKATKIIGDPKTDLAVLRIEGADRLQAAKLGDSDRVEVGDWVLALGHPFGLEGTVTAGIVSAKGRGIGMAEREDYIQTDAAINPGNSGGPLVNLDGEVIGINTAISSSSGGNEGVGFAIPINLAKWVSQQLTKDGTVHRARLGVVIQPLSDELAKQFGLKAREGVLVAEVMPESPGAKAGLKPGDVIVEFAGKAVSTPQELQAVVEQARVGHEQTMSIVRAGKRTTLKANPAELPGDGKAAGGSQGNDGGQASRLEKLGMEVQTLTAEVAKQLEIKADHGVVVTAVQPGSPAERAGLAAGAVILEANRKPVKTVEDLTKALDEKSLAKGVLLLVRTAEGSRFVVIRG